MDDFYVKDSEGNYIPVSMEMASARELADKLIVITVGSDEEPADQDTLEHVYERFAKSKVVIEALKRSSAATNLLILPHIFKLELLSRRDLDTKTICVRVGKSEDIQSFPELKNQIQDTIGKEVVVLPVPLSLNEYNEIKAIRERARIRKQRNGGGLNTSKK